MQLALVQGCDVNQVASTDLQLHPLVKKVQPTPIFVPRKRFGPYLAFATLGKGAFGTAYLAVRMAISKSHISAQALLASSAPKYVIKHFFRRADFTTERLLMRKMQVGR